MIKRRKNTLSYLKKSNNLIDCLNNYKYYQQSRYPNTLEQRIFIITMESIIINNSTYASIDFSKFIKGGKNITAVICSLRNLLNTHVEYIHKKLPGETTMISDFQIIERSPLIIKIFITQTMYELYNCNSNYTRIYLYDYLKFKCKYSFYIYDFCLRWGQMKEGGIVFFSKLRTICNLPESYKSNDILKRVVYPALNEINSIKANKFKIIQLKKGRLIIGIQILTVPKNFKLPKSIQMSSITGGRYRPKYNCRYVQTIFEGGNQLWKIPTI